MKVRIMESVGNGSCIKEFDSTKTPVMIIMEEADKHNISHMSPDALKYASYPDEGFSEKQIKDFMNG